MAQVCNHGDRGDTFYYLFIYCICLLLYLRHNNIPQTQCTINVLDCLANFFLNQPQSSDVSIWLWRAADVSTHVIRILGLLLLHEAGAGTCHHLSGVPSHRSHFTCPEDGSWEHAWHPNSDIVYACTCGASACIVGGVCVNMCMCILHIFSISLFCACVFLFEHVASCLFLESPGGTSGKDSACQHRRLKRLGFSPQAKKIPWRRAWPPTPISLPGKSHGQRSPAAYSP